MTFFRNQDKQEAWSDIEGRKEGRKIRLLSWDLNKQELTVLLSSEDIIYSFSGVLLWCYFAWSIPSFEVFVFLTYQADTRQSWSEESDKTLWPDSTNMSIQRPYYAVTHLTLQTIFQSRRRLSGESMFFPSISSSNYKKRTCIIITEILFLFYLPMTNWGCFW